MKSLLIFIFVFLLPLATAIDCSNVANKQWCAEIQSSGVSEADKEYLLSDIISDKKFSPELALVEEWNLDLDRSVAPSGVIKQNKGYIKNAWLHIYAVMPAVLLNDTLLIPNQGKMLSGSGYNVQLPSGKDYSDCKTVRSVIENNAHYTTYLNADQQGGGNYADYTTSLSGEVTLRVEYKIKVVTKITHYRWKKVYDYWQCKYYSTNYKTDELVLTDEVKAKIHNPSLSAQFKIEDQYWDTVKGKFTFNPTVNVNLEFLESSLKQHNYVFSEKVNNDGTLTIEAKQLVNLEEKNLKFNQGEVIVPSVGGCKIKVEDFFKSSVLPCDLSYTNTAFSVSTDQLVYDDSEEIKVNIVPAGDYVVSYTDKKYNVSGSVSLSSVYPYNRITVQSKDRTVYAQIHIKNEKPLAMFFSLGLLGLLNYVGISFFRRYWGSIA